MKKSLIAIAALGIMSGSAFADTASVEMEFNLNVLSSCTFDNLGPAKRTIIVPTAVAGVVTIDAGTQEIKRTCSQAMGYNFYASSPTVILDNSTSPDANGEQLKITAYADYIGGDLVPVRSGGAGPDQYWGTGAEQTETIAFQVTNAAGGKILNRHYNEKGSITFTIEYTPH